MSDLHQILHVPRKMNIENVRNDVLPICRTSFLRATKKQNGNSSNFEHGLLVTVHLWKGGFPGHHVARGWAIEMHMDISQGIFFGVVRKSAGHTGDHLEWTSDINHVRRSPECGHTVCGTNVYVVVSQVGWIHNFTCHVQDKKSGKLLLELPKLPMRFLYQNSTGQPQS